MDFEKVDWSGSKKVVGVAVVGFVMLLWKEVKIITFDPDFARSIGLPATLLDAAMTAMVAFAVVIGLEMVGVVLMSAMLVAPAAAAVPVPARGRRSAAGTG